MATAGDDAPAGLVLGVDLGARRVGIAVGDARGRVAAGLCTLTVRGVGDAVEQVARVAGSRGASRIVVGLPLNMNGTEGGKAEEARRFAALLSERTGSQVLLWDERLTSVQARAELGRHRGRRSASRDKGRVDVVAATILLQSYLDSLG